MLKYVLVIPVIITLLFITPVYASFGFSVNTNPPSPVTLDYGQTQTINLQVSNTNTDYFASDIYCYVSTSQNGAWTPTNGIRISKGSTGNLQTSLTAPNTKVSSQQSTTNSLSVYCTEGSGGSSSTKTGSYVIYWPSTSTIQSQQQAAEAQQQQAAEEQQQQIILAQQQAAADNAQSAAKSKIQDATTAISNAQNLIYLSNRASASVTTDITNKISSAQNSLNSANQDMTNSNYAYSSSNYQSAQVDANAAQQLAVSAINDASSASSLIEDSLTSRLTEKIQSITSDKIEVDNKINTYSLSANTNQVSQKLTEASNAIEYKQFSTAVQSVEDAKTSLDALKSVVESAGNQIESTRTSTMMATAAVIVVIIIAAALYFTRFKKSKKLKK